MNEEFETVVEKTNENTDAQTVEETEEGIELTDTAEAEGTEEESAEGKEKDSKPQGRYVTDEELNELANKIADKRVARKMSKKEKEYEEKLAEYQDIENVLNAGLGTTNIREATKKVRESYAEQGIELPERVIPNHSQRENELLGKAEADLIIEEGYDAMVEEANRLSDIGYNNLDAKDRATFDKLAEKIYEEKDRQGLRKIGAKEGLLKDEDFINFRKKFVFNTPIEEVYNLYKKNQPKPQAERIGSMKNTEAKTKDFISEAEYDKMSRAEVRANMDLIEKSMPKW